MHEFFANLRRKLFHPKTWPAVFRSFRFWLILVVSVAGLIFLQQKFDLETVREEAPKLNGVLAFALLTLLPLGGFPVSVLHVAAGVRFGIPLGLLLVWLSILLQLLASFALVHWRRRFFARRFKAVRDKIPAGAHAPVTVFTLLIPGAPYFAKNYVLPLIGVPLRFYLGIGFPIHAARSSIAVIFGGQSHQLTAGRVCLMLAYFVMILAVSWWALRRLQAKLADQPPAGNGRKRAA